MNNIKNAFSIKDLENLSGIKAHTIRIWEKRYKILEPMRTDTNIRVYDIHNLQKLLNISTLHTFGYKISTIAKIPEERFPVLVREIMSSKNLANHVLNSFKIGMMNFSQAQFLSTYNSLLQEMTFREIFYEYFIPLLTDIGYLWQTETITPAHEHFISYLIKQKLASNTEKLPVTEKFKNERTYLLFLPMNEIHEIGLMFINYELVLNGYRTVFLGESVPVECLKDVKSYFHDITFITYMTVEPAMEEVNNYIRTLKQEVLDNETELLVFGRNAKYISDNNLDDQVKQYTSIKEFTETI
jgi:DNA-binding transcriptional MerR regulator